MFCNNLYRSLDSFALNSFKNSLLKVDSILANRRYRSALEARFKEKKNETSLRTNVGRP